MESGFWFEWLVEMSKCWEGKYEGDGNGILYVLIEVSDEEYLCGERNF